MNEQTTSTTLLVRLRDPSDAEAWDRFTTVYCPLIRRYCLRRGIQESDTDDIVQNVLASVHRSIGGFEYQPQRGRFRAWFGTITANEVKRFFHRKNRQPRQVHPLQEDEEEPISGTAISDPDEHWVELFSDHILQVACDLIRSEFASQTWSTFECLWAQRMEPAEVARLLGISIANVYLHKSRVMRRLEQVILELAEDVPHATRIGGHG